MQVQDGIQGQIRLSRMAFRIINTREFKELKNLKQLGNNSEVYTTASHSRIEHTLRIYHLTKTDVQKIKKLEEEILSPEKEKMTPHDQLCVEIAALLHDLGHGNLIQKLQLGTHRKKNNQSIVSNPVTISLEITDLAVSNGAEGSK